MGYMKKNFKTPIGVHEKKILIYETTMKKKTFSIGIAMDANLLQNFLARIPTNGKCIGV